MTLDEFLDAYRPNEQYLHLKRQSPVVTIREGLEVSPDRLDWAVHRTYVQCRRASVPTNHESIRAAYQRRRAANGTPQNTAN